MGYLDDSFEFQYATKEAQQMKAVARMIERVAGIDMYN